MSIITVIIICFLPLLLFFGWSKKYREKHPEAFSYVLSIIGTFVGVAVGLYFTDLAAAKEKKQRAVKVLQASKEEMEWLIARAVTLDTAMENIPLKQRPKAYYLEMPPFFAETLRSELLAETLHPKTLEQFNLIRENLLFDVELLRKDYNSKNIKNLEFDLEDYKDQIKSAIDVVDKEINLLENKTKKVEFEKASESSLKILMQK
jgi:hypothetical protein